LRLIDGINKSEYIYKVPGSLQFGSCLPCVSRTGLLFKYRIGTGASTMAKLIDFYTQHRRLFLSQKHENISKTENYRNTIMLSFLRYCESRKIYHTNGITKQTAKDFFKSQTHLSAESKRKYYLVLREFYRRFLKIEIDKDILK